MPAVNYFWDPDEDNIVKEFDDGGNTIADYTTEPFLYGDVISQRRSGVSHFYHFDTLGNTTELTDVNGNTTDTRRYSAFGETAESSGSTVFPFQYMGQKGYRFDAALGTYHVRRRDLRPADGRWTAKDPIGAISDPNVYRYVHNNPINHIDPSGLAPPSNPLCFVTKKATAWTVVAFGASKTVTFPNPSPGSISVAAATELGCVYERTTTYSLTCSKKCFPRNRVCGITCNAAGYASITLGGLDRLVTSVEVTWTPSWWPQGVPGGVSITLWQNWADTIGNMPSVDAQASKGDCEDLAAANPDAISVKTPSEVSSMYWDLNDKIPPGCTSDCTKVLA